VQFHKIGDINFFLLPSFSYFSFYQAAHSIFGKEAKKIIYFLFKNAGEDLGQKLRENRIMDPTSVLNELGYGRITVQKFPKQIKLALFNAPHLKPFLDAEYSEKVDFHLCGFFAGIFFGIFEKQYNCYESKCYLRNFKSCEFICRESDVS